MPQASLSDELLSGQRAIMIFQMPHGPVREVGVTITGKHTVCPDCGMVRYLVETDEGGEQWIACRGAIRLANLN